MYIKFDFATIFLCIFTYICMCMRFLFVYISVCLCMCSMLFVLFLNRHLYIQCAPNKCT